MIHEQIIVTALDLFSQYGMKGVSMNDIANHLKISKRTLYKHFESKEALLSDGLEYHERKLTDIWNSLTKKPYTVLETIILFNREIVKRPYWRTQKFHEEMALFPNALEGQNKRNEKFESKVMKLFKRGVEEGIFEAEINYKIVVKLAGEHLKVHNSFKSFSGYSCTEVHETILFCFLRGLTTEKGRAILERLVRPEKSVAFSN